MPKILPTCKDGFSMVKEKCKCSRTLKKKKKEKGTKKKTIKKKK